MTSEYKFKLAVLLLIIVIAGGIFGYMAIEDWTFLDALYMTIITVATVGFEEVHNLSTTGRIFTIGLIISSISILAYGITAISSFIIEGQFREIGRRRKMEAKIKKLKNHFIVCGEGKVCLQVVEELQRAKVSFVVIANNIQAFEEDQGLTLIQGDATDDEILKKAKIEDAKGLIACLNSDTDNLFITLSARALNPKLNIVAEAREEISQSKMLKAGANNVISPDIIGGRRMASVLLRPTVVSFLDVMTRGDNDVTLRLEEVKLCPNSTLVGKTLNDTEIRKKTGTLVVAIKDNETGIIKYNPPSHSILKAEDILLVLGEEETINKLSQLCKKD
ncbi:MAG: potassium channel protein [Candidatus Omnitrophica bacterium]|nr:potassium channel protein [Candidatus Omnitrophota bacterium]MBU1048275.1 potassium channel protein [Candidatus Omnitrophota bacterium]MBU1630388.1 potassium channel protein [Candidatus Omnitrophota bacterium]MBU1767640.1 potassium channel protein [Candidatus Omnitrophota bacterium]MBU1888687.1 potassium channel protein [Candidatus Omnitrophota bacterium]